MLLKERYHYILDFFASSNATAETELHFENPYQLVVAVSLSAQCTDKRVNMVTPTFFEKFPTPTILAKSEFEDVFNTIKSISYPNNKAKHLIAMADRLVNVYHSEVPNNIEDLQTLQGVGRKTANVIVSVIHNQPAMAVDTHVYRVSRRLGLVPDTAKTPLAVEKKLMQHLPKEIVPKAHHWLILHGRYTCLARSPKCNVCGLKPACKYFEKNNKTSII